MMRNKQVPLEFDEDCHHWPVERHTKEIEDLKSDIKDLKNISKKLDIKNEDVVILRVHHDKEVTDNDQAWIQTWVNDQIEINCELQDQLRRIDKLISKQTYKLVNWRIDNE